MGAFILAYTVGFGETVNELSSVGATGVYLCRSFLGDIDLTPVYNESPMFGAALILFFILGVYFLLMNVFFAILAMGLDESLDRKVQDFRQEMLIQSLQHMKQQVMGVFSIERKVRAIAPGLWAQLYKKRRLKRRQEEKKRMLDNKAQQKRAGERAMALRDRYDAQSASSSMSFGDVLSKKDVLGAIEHMAGNLLSKIQGASFELTDHAKYVQSNCTKLEQLTTEAASRLGRIYDSQTLMQET